MSLDGDFLQLPVLGCPWCSGIDHCKCWDGNDIGRTTLTDKSWGGGGVHKSYSSP